MASKKNQQLRAAKDKRQKKIAIGGAVLLVAVMAIQVPKLLKHGSAPRPAAAAAPATTSTTPATTTTPATSTPASPAVVPTAQAGSTQLTDSDVPVAPGAGQLVVFDRFQSKDPFVQQVSSDDSSTGAAAAPTSAGTTPAAAGTTPASSSVTPSTTVLQPVQGAKTAPAGIRVVISTNGVSEPVTVGSDFPSKSPVFQLVSVTSAGAQIAVAGGSYADGSATVTLVKGTPLTLLDTTTHEQYRLVFVSITKS